MFKIFETKNCIWTTLSRDLLKNTCYNHEFIDISVDKKQFIMRFRNVDFPVVYFDD